MFLKKTSVFLFVCILLNSKNIFSAEGMPQFNAETFPSQLFWLVITFTLLYLFINFLVLPRIRDNLRLRKNKISNDIERAELIKSNIEKIVKDYEFKIDKARDKANLIVKESAKKAQQDFFSQLESSKNKIEQKILNAEKEIVAYKDNFSSDINEISFRRGSAVPSP